MFIWHNHLALLIKIIHLIFANLEKQSITSTKHLELGIMSFTIFSLILALRILILIHLCLYLMLMLMDILYLLVYIDDFILIGDNLEIVDYFVQTFAHWFSIKDLGFLGVKVIRIQYGILLFSKMIYYGHSSSYSYDKCEATFHFYKLVEILLVLLSFF